MSADRKASEKMMETGNGVFRIRDKADFEALFHENYSPLCAYANGFLKDVDASEEVVQEVMFRIWVGRESLEITSSVRSYLYRSVRNRSLNMLKHASIRQEYRSMKEKEGIAFQRSNEEEMIVSELDGKIRKAIDALPMERRKVFIMSRYDGMSYREIADSLGISVKTVENQVGKALKFLREELSEYLPLVALLFNIFKN